MEAALKQIAAKMTLANWAEQTDNKQQPSCFWQPPQLSRQTDTHCKNFIPIFWIMIGKYWVKLQLQGISMKSISKSQQILQTPNIINKI